MFDVRRHLSVYFINLDKVVGYFLDRGALVCLIFINFPSLIILKKNLAMSFLMLFWYWFFLLMPHH